MTDAAELKRNILVVDDEPQIRRVLRTSLAGHGYNVRTAGDGDEAMEIMREWKTRLAVSFTSNGTNYLISPIDSFSPTFALNAEAMHSIEQTHIGVIYSPP